MGLCLVTGGAGFIGRWLVSELLQRRRRVLVLDNLSGGCRANLAEFSGRPGYEGLIRGDIRNPGTLYELFFRGIECCYHLAPGIDAGKSLEEPQETFESVVGGTMGLLEMCREYDTKMVFVSTSRVYAESGAAIAEDFPLAPRSPYAACKLAAENLCLGYHRGPTASPSSSCGRSPSTAPSRDANRKGGQSLPCNGQVDLPSGAGTGSRSGISCTWKTAPP